MWEGRTGGTEIVCTASIIAECTDTKREINLIVDIKKNCFKLWLSLQYLRTDFVMCYNKAQFCVIQLQKQRSFIYS